MDKIGRRTDRLVNPAIFERALDVVSSAVLLVGPNCEVLWANREGRSILDREDGIGRKELAMALTRVHLDSATAAITTLPRPSGRRPYQMAVVPVPPSSLVFLHDPESPRRCCPEALRELYGFTKAEAAVASALASGMNLSEIAEELDVSTNTVRAHLKRLFVKTRTSRQAELVLLLGAGVVPQVMAGRN